MDHLPFSQIYVLFHNAPYAVEETIRPFYASIRPRQITFGRSCKQDKETSRIGTIFLMISSGDTTFPLDLLILLPSKGPCPASRAVRMVPLYRHSLHHITPSWRSGHKSNARWRVQCRRYIDRHSSSNWLFRIERHLVILWITIAQMVPRRTKECIHCIRFSDSRATTFRTRRMEEGFTRFKRRCSASCKLDVVRKFYWKLVFRNKLFTAFITIYNRNRRTPVTLTRNQPIANAEVNRPMTKIAFFQPFRNRFLAFFNG